jgi:hypothetical protein
MIACNSLKDNEIIWHALTMRAAGDFLIALLLLNYGELPQ